MKIRVLNIFNTTKYGWKFDTKSLKKFLEENDINLKCNLYLKRQKMFSLDPFRFKRGNHYYSGEFHVIGMNTIMTDEEANETLLHEICHCIQAEKAGKKEYWEFLYRTAGGSPSIAGSTDESYEKNEFEIEANNFSFQHMHWNVVKGKGYK